MLIIAVPIIVTAPDLLEIWLGIVPDYAVDFVRWTMVYLLLNPLSRMLVHAILSEGNIKACQIVVGGTKLMAIPMVYVMLKLGMSPLAGVWANIFLDLVCIVERLYFNHKLLGFDYMQFARSVLLKCAVLFAVSFGLSYMFYRYVTDMFIPSAAASLMLSLMTIWLIGLNKDERQIVIRYLKKIVMSKK